MIARLMGLKTISVGELRPLVEARTVTVIDVNSPQSWLSARVPGALHLDPLSYESADLPYDKTAALVFYCSNSLCRKAPNAALRARAMGCIDVRVLSAGISGWLQARLPTEHGPLGEKTSTDALDG